MAFALQIADAASPAAAAALRREKWLRARRVEKSYAAQLMQAARHVGEIVRLFTPNAALGDFLKLRDALVKYSEVLKPWSEKAAAIMLFEVDRKDASAWAEASRELALGIDREIRGAPTGIRMRELMAEQVRLITSLPLEAAQRVHHVVIKGMTEGRRAEDIEKDVLQTGPVTVSRARLIARTEVGRAAASLTQARAEYVGSEAYVWQTAGDSDVRPSHRAMQGKIVSWSEPPMLDKMRGHAGALPNCRCYSAPILPEVA